MLVGCVHLLAVEFSLLVFNVCWCVVVRCCLFVVCCLLIVVCVLAVVVRCVLCVVCCLMFFVRVLWCLSFAVCWLLVVAHCCVFWCVGVRCWCGCVVFDAGGCMLLFVVVR